MSNLKLIKHFNFLKYKNFNDFLKLKPSLNSLIIHILMKFPFDNYSCS